MIPLEKFYVSFTAFTGEFLLRLDRNFQRLAEEFTTLGITANYTLNITDTIVSVHADATAGALNVYLPSTPTGNRRRTITKIDSTVNIVTVDGNGSLINGFSQQALGTQYDSITVEPTGTGWLVVACVP